MKTQQQLEERIRKLESYLIENEDGMKTGSLALWTALHEARSELLQYMHELQEDLVAFG